MTGTNTFLNNSAFGIAIDSNGLITVNNITANGNDTSHITPGPMGVSLNNTSSTVNSGITVGGTNNLSGNYFNGLYVFSNGPIKINNLTADTNTLGAGAILTNNTATGAQPVTFTGTNHFDGNGLSGLIVYSNGPITINNVTANSNGTQDVTGNGDGAYLDNCNDIGSGCTNLFVRAVYVLGSNEFDGNYNDGLNIQSLGGGITLNNIEADGNGTSLLAGVGVRLDNDYSTVQAGVNITGTNEFNGNYDYGLIIFSNGPITANNITADSTVNTVANFGDGVYIDNCFVSGTSCTAPGVQPVTLTGSVGLNEFNGNASNGLVVKSRGAITLNNITADSNGIPDTSGVGTLLQNNYDNATSGVTLKGTNGFNSNYGYQIPTTTIFLGGLAILSKGIVKGNNLTGNLNTHGDGVYINNAYAGISRSVTLTGLNTFNDNGYDGLDIESFGNIAASNLNATHNGFMATGSGAVLYNRYINSSSVLSTGTVTLTGTNIFTLNYGLGLQTYSNGAITMMNLNANSNANDDGAYLDNTSALTAQPVTINGSNAFNYNNSNGLTVKSNGAISVKSITAKSNITGYGALLTNNNPGSSSSVTLSGYDLFVDNSKDGLNVASFGSISLNTTSLTANGNGAGLGGLNLGDGVYLDNYLASSPKAITVKGMNSFNNNHGAGIVIYSKGAITASNLTSSNNQTGWGAELYNDFGGAVGNVTLSGNNNFYGNSHDGLTITSRGAITLSNIVSNANGQLNVGNLYGIDINNTNAANLGVTISGTNVLNDNWSGGLHIITKGAIKINNLTAIGNSGDGGELINSTGPASSGVTFTGANFFEDNSGDGLNILTSGKVTLTRITADGNTGDGLNVTTPLSLTLTCGSFTNNTFYGIYLTTTGTATITGAVLSGNSTSDSPYQAGTGALVIVPTCPYP
jgi:hypothetical protein